MSDRIACRVCCPDGTVMAGSAHPSDALTYDEAVEMAQELDMDADSHLLCVPGHVVEMFAGWVPVATTRANV